MPTLEPQQRPFAGDADRAPRRQACGAAAAAMAATCLAAGAPWAIQWLVLGLLVSLLLAVVCQCAARLRWIAFQARGHSLLDLPLQLAADQDVFRCYESVTRSLIGVSNHRDPIYRRVAVEQLDRLAAQLDQIAGGTLVFEGTETWRIVYETLLRSPGLHLYRSVAWVKNRRYWQDEPGRKSMAVNYELHAAKLLTIERIAIIADELWPAGEPLPDDRVRLWIHEQHDQGIGMRLVREALLVNERELVADIGIYGFRAVGGQELDEACRTVRFTLTFDVEQVKAAEARWERLSVYAIPYSTWLDQFEIPV